MSKRVFGILIPVLLVAAALAGGGLFVASAGATVPTKPYKECPALGEDTSCMQLIVITNGGATVYTNGPGGGGQPYYDGSDDVLIGVVNQSTSSVSALNVTGQSGTTPFAFDGDGGCQVTEPSGAPTWTNPPSGCPYGPTGFEGPDNTFSNYTSTSLTGTVDFNGPFKPGDTTWFTLEGLLQGAVPTVAKDTPTVTTNTPATAAYGASLGPDVATVTGTATTVTGTVTFSLYTPTETNCSGTPFYTDTVTLSGGQATSGTSKATTVAGTYQWQAVYNGNPTNNSAPSMCGSEPVTVGAAPRVTPTVTTTPSPASGPVGTAFTDTAVLTSTKNLTGTITFDLYGPADLSCSGTPRVSTVRLGGTGTTVSTKSTSFTPTAPGTYEFVAHYSGDASNNAVAGQCSDRSERISVTKAAPTLTTTASLNSAKTGTQDTAHLTGGYLPGNTIKFQLYAESGGVCGSAVPGTSSTVVVHGNGNYSSGAVVTPPAGNYVWVASYSGDTNNSAAGPTACNDPAETVAIVPTMAVTSLSTQASRSVPEGDDIFDVATLTGGNNPTGTITFSLYGPGDTSCSQAPYNTSTRTVSGNGQYTSDFYTAVIPGTYRWTASYSGDSANKPSSEGCNAPNESVVVTPTLLTGRAYALGASVNALGVLGLKVGPVADTGFIKTADSTTTNPCTIETSGLIQATILCGEVDTYASTPSGLGHSVAKSHVANLTINLEQITRIAGIGEITADVIDTRSATDCTGSTGSTTIANLKINDRPVVTAGLGPNSTIEIEPGVLLVINEQTDFPGGLTVNALHLKVDLLGVKADVVVASSSSDIENCP